MITGYERRGCLRDGAMILEWKRLFWGWCLTCVTVWTALALNAAPTNALTASLQQSLLKNSRETSEQWWRAQFSSQQRFRQQLMAQRQAQAARRAQAAQQARAAAARRAQANVAARQAQAAAAQRRQ